METKILDVAIVGGGIAGIYSAWRLTQRYPGKTIRLYEADDHIGGRLLSVKPPEIDDMVVDLGGMRFLPDRHVRLNALIDELNQLLPPPQRIETYPFPVDVPSNISYLRGTHLRYSDFTDHPEKLPYNLTFLETGQTAGQIITNALKQIVPGITNPSLTDADRQRMAQKASFNGQPLYKQGLWQVLARVLSGEAYQFAVDGIGYHSILTNWNAADAIPWFLGDFGSNASYQAFKKGFQYVPLAIQSLIPDSSQVVKCKARVSGFHWHEDKNYVEIQFYGEQSVKTKSLILAMPRRALELITHDSPLLQKASIRQLITSVTPRPLFKLYTVYEDPWWLAANVNNGRSISDLPLQQTYYWPKSDGSSVTEGPAMLLASYDDGNNVGFWDGFRPMRGQDWRQDNRVSEFEKFVGEDDHKGSEEWQRYCVPKSMVEEIQRQASLIHGLAYIPKAKAACFRDWGDDPFGGGWNSWNIGVKSWEVKKKIIQPMAGVPVYICGEAYSDVQAWVEGALQTADMMLENYFILV
jgi:monoamine oxidase